MNNTYDYIELQLLQKIKHNYDSNISTYLDSIESNDDKMILCKVIENNINIIYDYCFKFKNSDTNSKFFRIISEYSNNDFVSKMLLSNYKILKKFDGYQFLIIDEFIPIIFILIYDIKNNSKHINPDIITSLLLKSSDLKKIFKIFHRCHITNDSELNLIHLLIKSYGYEKMIDIINKLTNNNIESITFMEIISMVIYKEYKHDYNLFEISSNINFMSYLIEKINSESIYIDFVINKCNVNIIFSKTIENNLLFNLIYKNKFNSYIDINKKIYVEYKKISLIEQSIIKTNYDSILYILENFINYIDDENKCKLQTYILMEYDRYEWNSNQKFKSGEKYLILKKISHIIFENFICANLTELNDDDIFNISKYFFLELFNKNIKIIYSNSNLIIFNKCLIKLNKLEYLKKIQQTDISNINILNFGLDFIDLNNPNLNFDLIEWIIKRQNYINQTDNIYLPSNTILNFFNKICSIDDKDCPNINEIINLIYENIIKNNICTLLNIIKKKSDKSDKSDKSTKSTKFSKSTKSTKFTKSNNDYNFGDLIKKCHKTKRYHIIEKLFDIDGLEEYFIFIDNQNYSCLQLLIINEYPNDFIIKFIKKIKHNCFIQHKTININTTALIEACIKCNHQIVIEIINTFGENIYSK